MIAVVVVILNHLANWPRGGFVGVDVFFVISGYLIVGLLLREHERTGTISFANFYVRRVKRIIPGAWLVLLTVVAAAGVLTPGSRFHSTVRDTAWAVVFGANWHFARLGTDYFAQGLPPSPVQHYWSLSVEEQFYLVAPWLMLGVLAVGVRRFGWGSRGRRIAAAALIGVITVGSLGYAFHDTSANPTSAYFSSFARAWELGLGALVAIAAPSVAISRERLRTALAWLGLAGVVASLFLVSASADFPAPWALLPVISTGLVIVAGEATEPAGLWPLTNPVSTYLGDISYSLYLWHFPVVVLLVSLLASGTAGYYAVATVLILVLSIGSYHLVEDPIRRSSWLTGRGRARVWLPTWTRRRAAAFAGMAVIGVVLLAGSAALERHQVASAATGPKASSSTAYRCRGANQIGDPQCAGVALGNVVTPSRYAYADDVGDAFACWTYPGQPLHSCTYGSQRPGALRVALVGDSHAASLLPALTAAPRARQWSITTFVGDGCDWSTSSCPAISATQQRLLDDPKFDLIITTADRQFTGPDPVSDFTQLWQPVAARGTRIAVVADVPAVPASMRRPSHFFGAQHVQHTDADRVCRSGPARGRGGSGAGRASGRPTQVLLYGEPLPGRHRQRDRLPRHLRASHLDLRRVAGQVPRRAGAGGDRSGLTPSATAGGDRGEQRVGQLRPADQQLLGESRRLVVFQRVALEIAHVQSGAFGDHCRRGRIPLLHRAAVQVGVRVPEQDRHRLHPRAADRSQHSADPLRDVDHPVRPAGAADCEPRLICGRRQRRQRVGSRQGEIDCRQRDRAVGQALTALPQRDVDGPVGAPDLTELGRAVERVDDPDPVGIESATVISRLFGQHDVVRPRFLEGREQLDVRVVVAGVPQVPGVGEALALPQGQQQLAGCGREIASQLAVSRHLEHHSGANGGAGALVDHQERAGGAVAAVFVDEQRPRGS
jgi:peptidoglycan/LPS O-acetylase OafA/YrhL